MPRRFDRRVLVAVVAGVGLAAGVTAALLASGPTTPTTVEGYYIGHWQVSGEMVGLHAGRVVPTPAAPPGLVDVGQGSGGLFVTLRGFAGVPGAPVPASRDALRLSFATPDAGQARSYGRSR
jgi:hypothetical protein